MKDYSYQYYAGSMVYNSDKSLKYILFEEGLVNKSSGAYTYEYHLKDHLGNTRVAFQPNGGSTTTTQVAEYYPFGSSYPPINPTGSNKYLYNGKEKQDDVLSTIALDEYDYGARFYDPRIGRWHVIDPKAEIYVGYSPYSYTNNNPVLFNDPNGQEIWIYYGDNQKAKYENGKLYNEDGSKYKGKDKFVSTISSSLIKMNSTDNGKEVLSDLSSSKNDFNFTNTYATDKNGNKVADALNFDKASEGGGEIHAGAVMGNMKESQKIESVAHELFHGFQYENGQNPGTVNGEVDAYLYGRAITGQLGNPTMGFGNSSLAGEKYQNAMNTLLYNSKTFNSNLHNQAINNFIKGSSANNGLYNTFKIQKSNVDPLIKKFFPLIK